TQNATITGTDVDVSASLFTLAGTGGYDVSGNGWGITGTSDSDASNTDSGANYLFIRGGALTTSFDASNYINFTITADTGSFNVTGASLFAKTGGSGQTTNFALRSDVDSFSADLLTGSRTGDVFQSFSTSTIAGITNQTSVEFRLYVWGASATSDTHRYDDISLTLAAVPEPSAFALLSGLMALGWIAVRRR
ncbi:MAG TPA: PEP-CTERM sorting domain-containing protein, partial [Opitutales bacterium]|nr:PEP-CTERM sorting domain-containing protein [Opitutales bacterium]